MKHEPEPLRESNLNSLPQELISREQFRHIRCPTHGCREVFFEVPKEFWPNSIQTFRCLECKREVSPSSCSLAERESRILYIHFWCEDCRKNFSMPISVIRKYCRGCKIYHRLFLYCHMDQEAMIAAIPHEICNNQNPESKRLT